MEVQKGTMKKHTDSLNKLYSKEYDLNIIDNQVIFQPKGRNISDFSTPYSRVMIWTSVDKYNDF